MKEKLIEARDRIKDQKNWCQGVGARTERGNRTTTNSPFATQWCAVGSLIRSGLDGEQLSLLSISMYGKVLTGVNDYLGHEAVMKVFDRAIQEAS